MLKFFFGENREGNYHPSQDPPLWITGGYGYSSAGVPVNAKTVMQLTPVYRAVTLLSNSVAVLPLILYRKNGDKTQRDYDNPLYTLLHDAPNDAMTSIDWRFMMMRHVLLRGNAYSQIIRKAGKIKELWPIHPDSVRIELNTKNKLIYRVSVSGKPDAILFPEELLHLKGATEDGITGLTPIQEMSDSIGGVIAAENHSTTVFKNNANPAGVLSYPKALTPERIEQIREHWQKVYGGTDNVGKTAILEGGMEWKPVTISNRDAQMLESRRFGIEQVARIFGVPPHKIGHLDHATFSNIEHQGIEYLTDGVDPYLCRFEQTIKQRLLITESDKDCYVEFLRDGLLRSDSLVRAQVQQIEIQSGTLSPNEARKQLNRNARDGGDEFVQPTAPQQSANSQKNTKNEEDKPTKEEDPAQNNEQKSKAREIFEPILAHEIGRVIRKETKKREQISQKPAHERAELMRKFYFEHRIYVEDVLSAGIRAINTYLGKQDDGQEQLEQIIAKYTKCRENDDDSRSEKELTSFYTKIFMVEIGL